MHILEKGGTIAIVRISPSDIDNPRASTGGSRRGGVRSSGEDSGECTTSATGTVVRWASWAVILSFALSFAPHGGDSRGAVDAAPLAFEGFHPRATRATG